jgi:hypothetical protein
MAHSLSHAMRPKLIDMKMSAREKKEDMPMPAAKYRGPDYPYELRITLDEDALKKLGLDASKINVGDKLEVMGVGEVQSVSQNKHANNYGDGKRRETERVEIQLKKIHVCEPGDMRKMGVKMGKGKY